MKYAIQIRMLFNTKIDRDKEFTKLKPIFGTSFKDPDTYLQSHTCYHDEDPNKLCVVEEDIK
jgi:hypothetical protein